MKRLYNIELLRVVCVVIVIFFHTVGRYSTTTLPTLPIPDTFLNAIIWAAVSLLLFISGFLFGRQIRANRYKSYAEMLRLKCVHIMIPYFVVATLLMLTGAGFDFIELLHGGFWHLWFLPMLFCCFVVYYPIIRLLQSSNWQGRFVEMALLAVSYAVAFIEIEPSRAFLGYDNMLRWGFFFVLGIIIANHLDIFDRLFSKYHLWIFCLTIWFLDITLLPTTPYRSVTWHNMLSVGLLIVGLFWLSFTIRGISAKVDGIILKLASASMGVYILHYWVLIYTTSSTALRVAGMTEDSSRYYQLALVVLISIVTFVISNILTHFLSKTKVGKLVIG